MHSDALGCIGLNRSEYCSWDAFNLNRCIGCGAHNQPGCLGCWKDADRFLFSARNLEFARYRYFLFRCTQFLVVCYAGGWRGSEGTGAVKFTCVLWKRSKTAIELALCFVPTKLNKSLKMHIYHYIRYSWCHARICICVWFFVFDIDWMFRSGTTTNFGGSRASMAAWRRSMCPGAFR